MRKTAGARRGSNLIYCIILVALLGLLAGGYALLLSYHTNSAVTQREFQQEYLAADSLREAVVESVLAGDNAVVTDISNEIKTDINIYKQKLTAWENLSEKDKTQAAANGDSPTEWLQALTEKTYTRSGTAALENGAEAKFSIVYQQMERTLSILMDYSGKEHYSLGTTLHTNVEPPLVTGGGIHRKEDGPTYINIPGKELTFGKKDSVNDKIANLDATAGDVYCVLVEGNNSSFSIDVSKINVTGGGRVFLLIGNGQKVTLYGQMQGTDLSAQLFIVSYEDYSANNKTRLTLSDNLILNGQIYVADATLNVGKNVTINGSITVSKDLNQGTPPNLTVNESTNISGIFSGTGVDSLGPIWGAEIEGGGGDISGDADLGYLADLTNWGVQGYYER